VSHNYGTEKQVQRNGNRAEETGTVLYRRNRYRETGTEKQDRETGTKETGAEK